MPGPKEFRDCTSFFLPIELELSLLKPGFFIYDARVGEVRKVCVHVPLACFDEPAEKNLLGIKQHGGLNACSRCSFHGVGHVTKAKNNNNVTTYYYPPRACKDAPKRTVDNIEEALRRLEGEPTMRARDAISRDTGVYRKSSLAIVDPFLAGVDGVAIDSMHQFIFGVLGHLLHAVFTTATDDRYPANGRLYSGKRLLVESRRSLLVQFYPTGSKAVSSIDCFSSTLKGMSVLLLFFGVLYLFSYFREMKNLLYDQLFYSVAEEIGNIFRFGLLLLVKDAVTKQTFRILRTALMLLRLLWKGALSQEEVGQIGRMATSLYESMLL
jgi:hypothetical protein